jgi:hypothetical protein
MGILQASNASAVSNNLLALKTFLMVCVGSAVGFFPLLFTKEFVSILSRICTYGRGCESVR